MVLQIEMIVDGIVERPVSRASTLDGAALVKQLQRVIEGIEQQMSNDAP